MLTSVYLYLLSKHSLCLGNTIVYERKKQVLLKWSLNVIGNPGQARPRTGGQVQNWSRVLSFYSFYSSDCFFLADDFGTFNRTLKISWPNSESMLATQLKSDNMHLFSKYVQQKAESSCSSCTNLICSLTVFAANQPCVSQTWEG